MKNFSIDKKRLYGAVEEVNSFAGRVHSLLDYAMLYEPDWSETTDLDYVKKEDTKNYFNATKLSYRKYFDITGAGNNYLVFNEQSTLENIPVSPGFRIINNYRVDENGIDSENNAGRSDLSHYLILSSAPAPAYKFSSAREVSSLAYFVDYYNTLTNGQTFTPSLCPLRYFFDGEPSLDRHNLSLNARTKKVEIMALVSSSEKDSVGTIAKKPQVSAWSGEYPIMPFISLKEVDGKGVVDEVVYDTKCLIKSTSVNDSDGDAIFGSLTVPSYIINWADDTNKLQEFLKQSCMVIVI